ncbi:HlyD family secretion protein [Rhodobacteraceae bacterium]|nr:HlyD family secretion protein [Paracoccaceae bacterium]
MAEARDEILTRAEISLQATLAVTRAKAALGIAQLYLCDIRIRAPGAGLSLSRNAENGDVATFVFETARDKEMMIEATLPDPDLQKLRPGAPATVRLSSNRVLGGCVDTIGGHIDPETRLAMVRISIEKNLVIAGSFVTAEIWGGPDGGDECPAARASGRPLAALPGGWRRQTVRLWCVA